MISILLAAVLAQAAVPAALPERTVTVTVVDEKGNAVEGLTAEDVAVQEEDGVALELVRLQADRRPLRVAVLVDSSVTMATSYRLHAVDAVLQFLLRLPEGSQYAVWTTGDRPKKVYGFGSDRAAVARALQRVIPQGGNMVLDAMVEASKELGGKEEARSALLVVTAMGVGFANYHRDQVVDAVADSGATLLAVAVEEGRLFPSTAGFGSDDRIGAVEYEYVLSGAAGRTGGVRDSLLSPMGLETALRRMAGELRGRYWLTYRGGKGDKPGDVEVTVARPGAKVRVGPGLR